MSNQLIWSEWHNSPFAAIKQAIEVNGTPADLEKVKVTILKILDWAVIDHNDLMDDLLAEIAREANIVVQYSGNASDRKYSAAYDTTW